MQAILSADYAYADQLIRRPEIYACIADDSCPEDPDKMPSVANLPGILLKMVHVGVPVGVFHVGFTDDPSVGFVHTLLEVRGSLALLAAQTALDWVWTHTDFLMLISHCPRSNPKARLYAALAGFKTVGVADDVKINGQDVPVDVVALKRKQD